MKMTKTLYSQFQTNQSSYFFQTQNPEKNMRSRDVSENVEDEENNMLGRRRLPSRRAKPTKIVESPDESEVKYGKSTSVYNPIPILAEELIFSLFCLRFKVPIGTRAAAA